MCIIGCFVWVESLFHSVYFALINAQPVGLLVIYYHWKLKLYDLILLPETNESYSQGRICSSFFSLVIWHNMGVVYLLMCRCNNDMQLLICHPKKRKLIGCPCWESMITVPYHHCSCLLWVFFYHAWDVTQRFSLNGQIDMVCIWTRFWVWSIFQAQLSSPSSDPFTTPCPSMKNHPII